MGNYNDYLVQLKGAKPALDDQRLRAGTLTRIADQAARKKYVLEGTLAILLLVTAAYFNFRPAFSGDQQLMAEYVYQQNDLNGDQIINYVFNDL